MQPEESAAGRIGDDDAVNGHAVSNRRPIAGCQVGGYLQYKVGAGGRGEKHRWMIAVGADRQRGRCRWYGGDCGNNNLTIGRVVGAGDAGNFGEIRYCQ